MGACGSGCESGPAKLITSLSMRGPSGGASGPVVHLASRGTVLPNNSGHHPKETYTIHGSDLGTGAFGTVRKATNKKSGMAVALKTINKRGIASLQAFQKEVDINMALDHPNIVRLYETFEDSNNVYLALEICDGGEIFDEIIKQGFFSEIDAARLLMQILRAVFYMHTQCIAHRDLKPENFLLKQKRVSIAENTLKVIDFGIATRFTRGSDGDGIASLKTQAGTAYYVAPEVLRGLYNEKCDVWSAGVILYILLSGAPPFAGDDDRQIMAAVKRGVISFDLPEFNAVSSEAKTLILKMCAMNPRDRLNADQALNTPWVQTPAKAIGKDGGATLDMIDNIRHFSAVSSFKKVALQMIVHRLDDTSIGKLREAFTRMDKNGDGMLSLTEMEEGFAACGMQDSKDVEALFQNIDVDKSGSISYTEFIASMIEKKSYLKEEIAWEAFRCFDRDGNGTISKDELHQMLMENKDSLESLSDSQVDKVFQEVDTDGDGKISFEEFMAMLQKGS